MLFSLYTPQSKIYSAGSTNIKASKEDLPGRRFHLQLKAGASAISEYKVMVPKSLVWRSGTFSGNHDMKNVVTQKTSTASG